MIKIAKVKTEHNQQTIILPADCILEGEEVYIKKIGDNLILISQKQPWDILWNSLTQFTDDFAEERPQLLSDQREELF